MAIIESYKQLLEDVMERLNKQFVVPATFTLAEKEGTVDVQVFVHGCSSSHYSSMDFFLEMIEEVPEHLIQVNKLSDYLIEYFIHEMKQEDELEALVEVKANLEFVYDQTVEAHRWFDEETKEFKVSFVPYQPNYVITVAAEQLKREYNNRFSSEDAPDILVDLAFISKSFEEKGYTGAEDFAKGLNRNITVEKFEESRKLKEVLFGEF